MTDNDTRTLLERACAKAVDIMLSGDVATVRQGTGHHVVIIRTVESEEREARTIQRREEHAERTKQDTERELSRVVDELAHVRETGAAELARASDALAGAAAEVDALRAEVARQTGIAVDHCARADAAEQMVVNATVGSHVSAGTYAKRVDERDAARAALAAAERARDEVGIQLAAAQAEIARMRPVVEAARRLLWSWDEGSTATERSRRHEDIRRALRALDTVSGDALAPEMKPATPGHTIDQIRAAFARVCLSSSVPFFADWPAIANGVCDALAPVVRGAPFDEAVNERDALRSEVARLTAEVEAMRAVVEAVNAAQDEADKGTGNGFGHYCDAVEKARALRARKVGG